MAAPIWLREDFDGAHLRSLAKASTDAKQTRRFLSLAIIYDGGSRSEAATTGGVGLQVVRDWVLRFNAEGPAGLLDRKAPGARPRLNDEQRRALAEIVESGPIPAIHGVVRWRRKDLVRKPPVSLAVTHKFCPWRFGIDRRESVMIPCVAPTMDQVLTWDLGQRRRRRLAVWEMRG